MNQLPTFKGYTVDFRLRQFRNAEYSREIEFIDFDSEKGQGLLYQLEQELQEIELEHAARMLGLMRRPRSLKFNIFWPLEWMVNALVEQVQHGGEALADWLLRLLPRKMKT